MVGIALLAVGLAAWYLLVLRLARANAEQRIPLFARPRNRVRRFTTNLAPAFLASYSGAGVVFGTSWNVLWLANFPFVVGDLLPLLWHNHRVLQHVLALEARQ